MTTQAATRTLHPDRLFPADPAARDVARRLYGEVRDLPIVSPHGHVDPRLLLDDVPFRDPTTLFVTPDHYVTRLLHASGVALRDLGVGTAPLSEGEARQAWRLFCKHWHVFRGTPVKFWLESEFAEIFSLHERPSEANADDVYDRLAAQLTRPGFRPRALYERFRIQVLATTDDPIDDLAVHAALAADPGFDGRVIPTFRPDRYLEPASLTWGADIDRLGDVAREDTTTYAGWVTAMERRRDHFRNHGAVSTDHSHADVGSEPLTDAEAERLYHDAYVGSVSGAEATALRRHMFLEMARMSADDGLTMTVHPGVWRNHHEPTHREFGPDTGHDIPTRGEFTGHLRPLLDRFGTSEGFKLVLFTLDESVFSRELAPLAGFYPTVYVGAPWWFLDAPEAITRWRSAITDTVGFTRTSGFIDDTRAFCSIPARHDMARRLDAAFLSRLVVEHRLDEDEAAETIHDLVVGRPREVFGL